MVGRALSLLLCAVLPTACGEGGGEPALEVWAASSLVEVMPPVARAFAEAGGGPVRLSFDATSRLARQIQEGAPADLFISADEAWMEALATDGLIDPDTRSALLGNRLVLAVPGGDEHPPPGPRALMEPRFARIGLAGQGVPAGRYASAALDRLSLSGPLRHRIVRGGSVRSVVAWIATSEVDAGIVYRTDALADVRIETAFVFPTSAHPPIVYPAAVVRGSPHAEDAADLLAFMKGPRARRIFREAGFEVRP